TSQKLGTSYPIFRFFFTDARAARSFSRVATRDHRVAVGSQKTFEKVLSKLSKKELGLDLQSPIYR
ncbi:MAG: hypothetical protein IJX46_10335, partial [Clostridia bacterium]|nr:hypothetical protein [Clostridia bacterium]